MPPRQFIDQNNFAYSTLNIVKGAFRDKDVALYIDNMVRCIVDERNQSRIETAKNSIRVLLEERMIGKTASELDEMRSTLLAAFDKAVGIDEKVGADDWRRLDREKWADRDARRRENPADFIRRVYGHEIEQGSISRALLRRLDFRLSGAFDMWVRRHAEDLPLLRKLEENSTAVRSSQLIHKKPPKSAAERAAAYRQRLRAAC